MIAQLDEQELLEIGEVYLFSNTPYFLFDRLRNALPVQRLANSQPTEALISRLSEIIRGGIRTDEIKVELFALLVALGLKSDHVSEGLLSTLRLPEVRWADELIRYVLHNIRADNRVVVGSSTAGAPTKSPFQPEVKIFIR